MTTTQLDWTHLAENHRDRIATLYGENITQRIIDSMAITYPAEGFVASRSRTNVVDLAELELACSMVADAETALAEAKEQLATYTEQVHRFRAGVGAFNATRRQEMRKAYRAGATAAAIAEVTGLSIPRVNQLVAGARQEA